MAYKIKSSKKMNTNDIAKHVRLCHYYLEDEARIVYGSSFEQLSVKEQKEIAHRVAKKYPASLRGV